jgi:hypothetical protein
VLAYGGRYSASGSGVLVSSRAIITCAHVVSDSNKFAVYFPSSPSQAMPASLIAADWILDLALLGLDAEASVAPVSLSSGDAVPGEQVTGIGYPGGTGPQIKTGRVVGFAGSFVQCGFIAQNGDSGGGLFRSDGSLAGVISRTVSRNLLNRPEYSEGAGVSAIRRFLAEPRCAPWFSVRPAEPPRPPSLEPERRPPEPPRSSGPDLNEIRKQLDRVQTVIADIQAKREGLDQRLKETEEFAKEQAKRAERTVGQLQDSLSLAKPVLDHAPRIASWLPWLPVIAGAAASGNLAPLVLVAGRAMLSRYRRKQSQDEPKRPEPFVGPVVTEPAPRQREYVPVEQPNGKLKALEEAMKKVAQDYPGAINVVRTIESVADQIYSGMEKKNASA